MRFEQISYWQRGVLKQAIVANPHEVNVFDKKFLTGKEVNKYGFKIRPPYSYSVRHTDGDGMVWAMIPVDDIIRRNTMTFDGDKLKRDDTNGAPDL